MKGATCSDGALAESSELLRDHVEHFYSNMKCLEINRGNDRRKARQMSLRRAIEVDKLECWKQPRVRTSEVKTSRKTCF